MSSGVGTDEAKVQDVGSDEYLLELKHLSLKLGLQNLGRKR